MVQYRLQIAVVGSLYEQSNRVFFACVVCLSAIGIMGEVQRLLFG